MITATTPTADVIALVEPLDPCEEGLVWLKKYDGQSFQSVIDALDTDPEWEDAWGIWFLEHLHADMIAGVRMSFIQKFAKTPRRAATLYLNLDWITTSEANALFKGFHSSQRQDARPLLPTIEKEIAEGKVKPKYQGDGDG